MSHFSYLTFSHFFFTFLTEGNNIQKLGWEGRMHCLNNTFISFLISLLLSFLIWLLLSFIISLTLAFLIFSGVWLWLGGWKVWATLLMLSSDTMMMIFQEWWMMNMMLPTGYSSKTHHYHANRSNIRVMGDTYHIINIKIKTNIDGESQARHNTLRGDQAYWHLQPWRAHWCWFRVNCSYFTFLKQTKTNKQTNKKQANNVKVAHGEVCGEHSEQAEDWEVGLALS